MLHTLLYTTSPVSSVLSAHSVSEVAALNPMTPVTGLWVLDLALEAALWTQVGVLAQLATLPAYLEVGNAWVGLDTQLQVAQQQQALGAWVAAFSLGTSGLGFQRATAALTWVFESGDVWLLAAELLFVSWLTLTVSLFGALRLRPQVGYDALVTLCQQRGVSVAEVFSLCTFMLGYLVFDMFVIAAEDDLLEAVSFLFGAIIGAALVLLAAAVDVQYYYMISAISGGEASLRILYTDVVNNGLCLLRVFFCWIRYLFYDLQAELVDFAFHYTETADELALEQAPTAWLWEDAATSVSILNSLTMGCLVIFLDAIAMLLQLLIGGFKLALALFLFWLILDLFLLRTIARTETLGWTQQRVSQKPRRRRVGWRYRRLKGWRY